MKRSIAMKPAYVLTLLFSTVIGAIALTHHLVADVLPPGMTCADERLASFGWTDKRVPLAELAAIETWQREAEAQKPGYSNWHQAYRRSMKCTRFRQSDHFQCVVSALPCKYREPRDS